MFEIMCKARKNIYLQVANIYSTVIKILKCYFKKKKIKKKTCLRSCVKQEQILTYK